MSEWPAEHVAEAGLDGARFFIPSVIDRAPMQVVASFGLGWDHVSVSRKNRCPNWAEMEQVRELFFKDDECVLQFSPPRTACVNVHPNCLHLWRNQNAAVELPPLVCV